MTRVPDLIAAALADVLRERTGWDEPPELCNLRVGAGQCEVRPIPLPTAVWASGPPAEVLRQMAADLKGGPAHVDVLRRHVPADLYGCAFRAEAWGVQARTGTPEAAECLAAARARRLASHPDRIEIRTVWAVDRAGISYDAMQERGSDEVTSRVVYPSPGSPEGFAGTVFEALDDLVTALLGVTVPDRGELGPGGWVRRRR